jgi:hypothetical protein
MFRSLPGGRLQLRSFTRVRSFPVKRIYCELIARCGSRLSNTWRKP